MPNITDESINRIENLLLPEGATFRDKKNERIEIIKCIGESKDINASPGSGKTTTLLAKLLLLAEQMPFKDGSGICILTHTNVAIDELKSKVGEQADHLFRYPNFFGTFQRFVNRFLTIPYYVTKTGKRPNRIDKEYYNETINNINWNSNFSRYINKKALHYLNVYDIRNMLCFNYDDNNELVLTEGINGKVVEVKEPWNARNKWSEELKSDVYKWLFALKNRMLIECGVLNYDDSYFLAFEYLKNYPKIKNALSARFKLVYVDEMQDTYTHQIKILERSFNDSVIIQRFGDPHQSIFNKVSAQNIWEPSEEALPISDSKRFGESIAKVLRTICIIPNDDLSGNEEMKSDSLPPHIIVYDEDTITNVLGRFVELIYELNISEVYKEKNRPIKAIGWVGPNPDSPDKHTIKTYFPTYNRLSTSNNSLLPNVKPYLRKQESNKAKDYFDTIINCFLRILDLAGIKRETDSGNRAFTKNTLLRMIRKEDEKFYKNFRHKIAQWIHEIINAENDVEPDVLEKVRSFINDTFLPYYGVNNFDGKLENFIESDASDEYGDEERQSTKNIFTHPNKEFSDIEVKVGTIHSAKGETHTATLYLETFYQGKRESESIMEQLCGIHYERPSGKKDTYKKETLKMAYVGMSRPSHLLCFAGQKENILSNRETLEDNGWIIIDDLVV